ncbi:MAG: hypothetical protein ACHREM_05030 [Polyangiales bacterium]
MTIRLQIDRAVHAALDDFARALEQRLHLLMGADDDKSSEPSLGAHAASSRPKRVASRATPARSTREAKVTNASGKRTAPPSATSTGLIEAKVLVALSDSSSLGKKALLAKARIQGRDCERAYAVLVRLRTQGKVVLEGEKRFAEYRLATSTDVDAAPTQRRVRAKPNAQSAPAGQAKREVSRDESVTVADGGRIHEPMSEVDDAPRVDVPILRAMAKARPVVIAGVDVDLNVLQVLTLEASVPLDRVRVDPDETASLTGLVTRASDGEIAALVIVRMNGDDGWAKALSDITRAAGLAVVTVTDAALETLAGALSQLDRAVAGG